MDPLFTHFYALMIGAFVGGIFGFFCQKAAEATAERRGFMNATDRAERSKHDELRGIQNAQGYEREVWKERVEDLKRIIEQPPRKPAQKPPDKPPKRTKR